MKRISEVRMLGSRLTARLAARVIVLLFSGIVGLALAQTAPVIYPAKGQGGVQQDRDKYECYDWARKQSGFDPLQALPTAVAAAPNTTSELSGMVKGAATGAAVGELTRNDAGRGAAIGVLGASLLARAQEAKAAQTKQQQMAQQQSARSQQRSLYERAFGACMEARGYTVK